MSALWRFDQHLSLDLFAERNDVSLPDTAFTADVFGTRINYAATTRLYLSAYVQYNAATEELVSNFRFNSIHSPLSDLFVLYTERRHTEGMDVLDHVFTIKVTKVFES